MAEATDTFLLFTDGGSRGNPGPAACGYVLFNSEFVLQQLDSLCLGEVTNNMAEYEGLLLGLKAAKKAGVKSLKCYMDSELIVMQINGAYRVKQSALKEKWDQAKALMEAFDDIKFVHVRREKNKFADKLVNIALDAQASKL